MFSLGWLQEQNINNITSTAIFSISFFIYGWASGSFGLPALARGMKINEFLSIHQFSYTDKNDDKDGIPHEEGNDILF